MAPLFLAIRAFLWPLASLCILLTRMAAGRDDAKRSPFVSRESLAFLMRDSEANGQISAFERAMVGRVLELQLRRASQLMTPLAKVARVSEDDPLPAVLETFRRSRHRVLPLFSADGRHCLGLLHLSDLLRARAKAPVPFDLRRAPVTVRGDVPADELLPYMHVRRTKVLIVTDGAFSMGGDIANLPEICALAQKYGARVMVDDAHGLGVIGEGGRGTASYYGLEDHVDIYMGTFSKSLASLGGYMAASSRVADFVRHSSRPFIFSASIPPANAAAALAALRELEAHPELVTKLQENSLYMRGLLNERNIKMRPSNGDRIPIIPIYTYEPIPTLTIAKELYERGVYVNSSLPPAAAPHECLLRTSLMATHTHALIDEAVGVIADVLRGYDL